MGVRNGVALSLIIFNIELETVERQLLEMDEGIKLHTLNYYNIKLIAQANSLGYYKRRRSLNNKTSFYKGMC